MQRNILETLKYIKKYTLLYLQNPESLEDMCIMSYLKYLESEVVTYIALTQSKSRILKGVAKRMLKVRNNSFLYIFTCDIPTLNLFLLADI